MTGWELYIFIIQNTVHSEDLRFGQILYNTLETVNRGLADEICSTYLDPFFETAPCERTRDFLMFVAEHIDDAR